MARSDGDPSSAGLTVSPSPAARRALTGTALVRAIAFAISLVLFVTSLRIPPEVNVDSGNGFLVLRSMQRGAGFNTVLLPDSLDITRSVRQFLAWWSPGQYLLPGLFESLGLRIGPAICLTVLIGTACGLAGWARVATRIGAPSPVTNQFVLALATVHFVPHGFRVYTGGEVLLFGCAPWALLALLYALRCRPWVAFGLTLLVGALLFFVKLTGLVVLAAVVIGLTGVEIASTRRLTWSVVAMWLAAIAIALLVRHYWLARGATPLTAVAPADYPNFNPLAFSIAAAAFSGVSALMMVASLASRPLPPVLPNIAVPVFATIGVCVMVWIAWRLWQSPHRRWMITCGAIALSYTALIAGLYLAGSDVSFEERHLRFAGILVFLLFLLAASTRTSLARYSGPLVAGLFGLYGAVSYAKGVPRILREHVYDRSTGLTVRITSPAALDYLRERQLAEATDSSPVVVVPIQLAVNLPGVRVIPYHLLETTRWNGRVDKIYVIPREDTLTSARRDSLLSAFVSYDRRSWRELRFGKFVVFSQ